MPGWSTADQHFESLSVGNLFAPSFYSKYQPLIILAVVFAANMFSLVNYFLNEFGEPNVEKVAEKNLITRIFAATFAQTRDQSSVCSSMIWLWISGCSQNEKWIGSTENGLVLHLRKFVFLTKFGMNLLYLGGVSYCRYRWQISSFFKLVINVSPTN